MDLTILSVPDCPNTPLLRDRLAGLLHNRPEVHLAEHTVTTDAEAQRVGMHGSPTLLIDGRDPFPTPEARPGLSCRIYRAEDGTAGGAPTPAQLDTALGDR